jgi:methylmalonyl-CoA mutase N-terminal domain/subunit
MLRFHTQTAGFSLTAQQPENNITRTSLQALAAVLGGTQSLHTNSMDETLALPSEKAAEIALRSQQIIAYEPGVTNTIDPLGGSWYIEKLTTEIEEDVYSYFKKIKDQGGVVQAIENSFFQREIAQASSDYQKKVDKKDRYIVGVNSFIKENEKIEIPILEIREEVQKEQIDRLNHNPKTDKNKKVKLLLKNITKAAKENTSVMPPIIEASLEYATLGEIVDSMKVVYGEWTENISI